MPTWTDFQKLQNQREAAFLREVLTENDWNLSRTAHALGMPISSLQRVLARHPELARAREKHGPGPGRPPQPAR